VLLSRFSTVESLAHARAFRPKRDDVLVATYSKSGTTLLQQIVHGLRTGGDLDFSDISEVVPWLEVAHDLGQDLAASQRAAPRAFKTHFDGLSMPRGGRVIYVVRDPIDVLKSFYRFNVGWFLEPGAMDLETFALEYLLQREGRHDHWHHIATWWPRLAEEDVLPLCYEDVVADLPGTVAQVARFIGVPTEADRIEVAARQATRAFMLQHPGLWEDPLLRAHRNPAMGLPPDARSTKVRRSEGHLEEVTDRIREVWARRWRDRVSEVTGCPDYAALRGRIASMIPS